MNLVISTSTYPKSLSFAYGRNLIKLFPTRWDVASYAIDARAFHRPWNRTLLCEEGCRRHGTGTHAHLYETSQFVLKLPSSNPDCSGTEPSQTHKQRHTTTSARRSGESHATPLLAVWYRGSATHHHHRYSQTWNLCYENMDSQEHHSCFTPSL